MTLMRCKLLHLLVVLLAAAGAHAADPLPPEGTAPIAPENPKGPFEITWITPRVDPHNFFGQVTVSRDGKRLLVALDGQARMWDTATWKAVGSRVEYGDWTSGVTLTADGKRLFVSRDVIEERRYADVEWRLWDVETGKPVGPVVRNNNPKTEKEIWTARMVRCSPDGQFAATAADGKTVSLFRTDTGEKLHALVHEMSVQTMIFDSEGKTLFVIDWHDKAHLWDIKTGKKTATHEGFFYPQAFRSGRLLANSFFGFRVIDAASGKVLLSEGEYEKYSLGDMVMSAAGNRVAIEVHRRCEIWDVDAGEQVTTVPASNPEEMDPKGTVLLVNHWTAKPGDDAFEAGMWDAQTGKKIRDLGNFIGAAAFSPDGNLLAIKNGRVVRVIRADPKKTGAERWKP